MASTLFTILVGSIPGSLALAGTAFYIHRSVGNSKSEKQNALVDTLKQKEATIMQLLKEPNSIVSVGEISFVEKKIAEVQQALDKERETLAKIESTLGEAQREVELKETEQQELKISKESDGQRLETLRAQAKEIESESLMLEQNLQDSLKDLARMIEELEENSQLRLTLEELSRNVESAANLLRKLHVEYKNVTQRLDLICHQQSDLEEEYTRLVEEQLNG
jgi:chromosome segregation ATPase